MKQLISDRSMAVAREFLAQPLATIDHFRKGSSAERVWARQSAPEIERGVNALAALIEAALADEREAQKEQDAKIADTCGDSHGALAERFWAEGDREDARIQQGWAASAQSIAAAIRGQEG